MSRAHKAGKKRVVVIDVEALGGGARWHDVVRSFRLDGRALRVPGLAARSVFNNLHGYRQEESTHVFLHTGQPPGNKPCPFLCLVSLLCVLRAVSRTTSCIMAEKKLAANAYFGLSVDG